MPASLLDLPFELQSQVASCLPLSSQYLLASQVCRQLRRALVLQHIRLRPHAYSIVEWQKAARECHSLLHLASQDTIVSGRSDEKSNCALAETCVPFSASDSIWEIDNKFTPKPAPAPAPSAARRHVRRSGLATEMRQCLESADDEPIGWAELEFLLKCIRLLVGSTERGKVVRRSIDASVSTIGWPTTVRPPLKVLRLLTPHLFGLSRLLDLFDTEPHLFSAVETVLTTSAECALWYEWVPGVEAEQPPSGCGGPDRTAGSGSERKHACVETQAIVIPGPNAKRGQGMRSGFKCLCYGRKHNDEHEALSTATTATVTEGGSIRSPSFHVILHDWYDEDEAANTEDMLANSDITCNWCRGSICF